MHDPSLARAVRVEACADGALLYLVALPPEALPPVRARDLAAAWDAARSAALAERWGAARLFRFRRADGSALDLALGDADAACWAGAVDHTVGMGHAYGLSLCLRLLALVDLLARARWAGALVALRRDGTTLPPALLTAAATLRLTPEGRFDEPAMRRQLAPRRAALAAPALLALLLARCATPESHADAVTEAACRARADQVFVMRHPDAVYSQDTYISSLRDAPFSTSGGLSLPNRGLSDDYEYHQLYQGCLDGTGPVGPTPAAPPALAAPGATP